MPSSRVMTLNEPGTFSGAMLALSATSGGQAWAHAPLQLLLPFVSLAKM